MLLRNTLSALANTSKRPISASPFLELLSGRPSHLPKRPEIPAKGRVKASPRAGLENQHIEELTRAGLGLGREGEGKGPASASSSSRAGLELLGPHILGRRIRRIVSPLPR